MILFFALACFDLPPDFENAQLIEDFVQRDCEGSAYDSAIAPTTASVVARDSGTEVAVGPLGFRCAQKVQGFWVGEGDEVSVLIQPVDMNPTEVAGCDCLYDVDFTLPTTTSAVAVYTRGDNLSGRSEATLEVTGRVE